MKHAYVTSMKCDACHEYGMTWKTNGKLWTRPSANHHAGQDCGGSGCHSSRDKLALRPAARTAPTATSGTANSTREQPHGARRRGTCGAGGNCGHGARHRAGNRGGALQPRERCGHGVRQLSQRREWRRQARRSHQHHRSLPELSHDARLAATRHGGSHAGDRQLRQLPQRQAGHRQALEPSAHDRGLRELPHHQRLDAGALRPRRGCAAHLRHLSQLGTRHRQAAYAHTDHPAVRRLPRHARLETGAHRPHGTHQRLRQLPQQRRRGRHAAGPHDDAAGLQHAATAIRTGVPCTSAIPAPPTPGRTARPSAAPAATAAIPTRCRGRRRRRPAPVRAATPRTSSPPRTRRRSRVVNYTVSEVANCSGACHVYSDTTQSTITKKLPGPYHRVSDARFQALSPNCRGWFCSPSAHSLRARPARRFPPAGACWT